MIEIEMSRDIRDFEPKIIGPLSLRQLIASAIGAVIAIPIAFYLPVNMEVRILLAMLVAAPAILCGFFKFYGMAPEIFFLRVMIPFYLNPERRIYETETGICGVPLNTQGDGEKQKNKKDSHISYRGMKPKR